MHSGAILVCPIVAVAVLSVQFGCQRSSVSWVKEPIDAAGTVVTSRQVLRTAMAAQGQGVRVFAECGHDLCHRKPSIFRLYEPYPVLAESYLEVEIARLPPSGETRPIQEAGVSGRWTVFGPGRFVQFVDLRASRGTVSWNGTTMTMSLEYEGPVDYYVWDKRRSSWGPFSYGKLGDLSDRTKLSFHLETRYSTKEAHRLKQWREEALERLWFTLPPGMR